MTSIPVDSSISKIRPGDDVPFFSLPPALPNDYRVSHIAKQIFERFHELFWIAFISVAAAAILSNMVPLVVTGVSLLIFIRIFGASRDTVSHYTVRMDPPKALSNVKGMMAKCGVFLDQTRFTSLAFDQHLDKLLSQPRRFKNLVIENAISRVTIPLTEDQMNKIVQIGAENLELVDCSIPEGYPMLGHAYFDLAEGKKSEKGGKKFQKGGVKQLGSIDYPLKSAALKTALKSFKKGIGDQRVYKLTICAEVERLPKEAQEVYNSIQPPPHAAEILILRGTEIRHHDLRKN